MINLYYPHSFEVGRFESTHLLKKSARAAFARHILILAEEFSEIPQRSLDSTRDVDGRHFGAM